MTKRGKKDELDELTEEQKAEQKRIKAAKERARSQAALSAIVEHLSNDIARDEVCYTTIWAWRDSLNLYSGARVRVSDFFVNSASVDPFYVDAPGPRKIAEWFVEQWTHFKPGAPTVHVRGLHYAVSRDAETENAIRFPNGKIYRNIDQHWEELQKAGKYARYLGLIDPQLFEDRRSREPIVKQFQTRRRTLNVDDSFTLLTDFDLEEYPDFPDFPAFPDFPLKPRYYLFITGQQRYRIEVWIEKSTMEDVIIPVCEKYQVTYISAQGEMSITSMWEAIDRAEKYGSQTTTVILYISDFDPAGRSMPVAAARKLEYWRIRKGAKAPMRLYPIALTYEQCVQFQLPRTPIKAEEKRRETFEYRYGSGATELDALESLHEGALATIVEEAILKFRDPTIGQRTDEREREIQRELYKIAHAIYKEYELDDLAAKHAEVEAKLEPIEETYYNFRDRYEDLRLDYEQLRKQFHQWNNENYWPLVGEINGRMRKIGNALSDQLPDIRDFMLPEAVNVPVNGDCLFDSNRKYVTQLAAYKQWQGKGEGLIEEVPSPDETSSEDDSEDDDDIEGEDERCLQQFTT